MHKAKGFTLIEVLIAVIILAIALIAVVRHTSLTANQTSYLQQRTIAHWLAMNIVAQTQTGLLAPPPTGSHRSGTDIMLNQHWKWQLSTIATAQQRVVKIQVRVFDTMTNRQMDNITSYILLPKK